MFKKRGKRVSTKSSLSNFWERLKTVGSTIPAFAGFLTSAKMGTNNYGKSERVRRDRSQSDGKEQKEKEKLKSGREGREI
jgi:hypothetical protein